WVAVTLASGSAGHCVDNRTARRASAAWHPRPRDRSVPGVSALAIVTRPVRADTWRELVYLLLGFCMSIVTFVVLVTLLSLGVSLLITLVGIPILLATAYVNRWFAHVERWRAGFVLRDRIDGWYRNASGVGFWKRARIVATDPQTWKDYAWLVVMTFVGFASGLVAIVFWSLSLAFLSIPVWWWIPPDPVLQINDSDPSTWAVDSCPRALLVGAPGLVATILTAWICAGLARGQALLARALLAPGLAERVDELERTRAGAVVAQQDELERIERDLHDGAQARLVALAIDLGLAQDKLA